MLDIKIQKITHIDKGIPFPQKSFSGRGKYPYIRMEQGDSFAAPVKTNRDILAVKSSVCQYNKRNKEGKEFAYKVLLENKKVIIRVWRIK